MQTAEPFVEELSLMTAGFNQIVLGVGVVIRLIEWPGACLDYGTL